jgi:Protein of unknown function (DUF2877)
VSPDRGPAEPHNKPVPELCGCGSDEGIIASIRWRRPSPQPWSATLSNAAAVLPATSLTPDVAARTGTLAGRVRSVHRAGIWLDLDEPGDLLAIALDDVGGIPGGILVGGIDDLRTIGVRPGMAMTATTEELAIAAAPLRIGLTEARVWSASLSADARLANPPAEGRAMAAWVVARELAGTLAPGSGLGPLLGAGRRPAEPWFELAVELLGRQTAAIRDEDAITARESTAALIGLGPGLTPSGDDYLVGLLAGLDAIGHPARPVIAAVVAAEAPGRTTAIGASLLRHAAHGAYAERLHDVIVALRPRSEGLAASIARAMAYGATSGADTLVGLFAGIGLPSAGSVGRAQPTDPAAPAEAAA